MQLPINSWQEFQGFGSALHGRLMRFCETCGPLGCFERASSGMWEESREGPYSLEEWVLARIPGLTEVDAAARCAQDCYWFGDDLHVVRARAIELQWMARLALAAQEFRDKKRRGGLSAWFEDFGTQWRTELPRDSGILHADINFPPSDRFSIRMALREVGAAAVEHHLESWHLLAYQAGIDFADEYDPEDAPKKQEEAAKTSPLEVAELLLGNWASLWADGVKLEVGIGSAGGFVVEFCTRSVVAAIMLQFVLALAEEAQLAECPECLQPFTPSRSDQVYCSERCRRRPINRRQYANPRRSVAPRKRR